jgi:hypothetical protein
MSAICAAYEAGVQEGAAGAEDQLEQTVADLAECEAELSVLDADLGICEADMGAVETALGTCESELASVQVALGNFFDSVPNCACWETYMSLDSCSGAGATLVGVSGTTLFGFHPDPNLLACGVGSEGSMEFLPLNEQDAGQCHHLLVASCPDP